MDLQESFRWIESEQESLLARLCELSAINSGSGNLPGIARVSEVFAADLNSHSGHLEVVPSATAQRANLNGELVKESYGDMLDYRMRPAVLIQVLLVGHINTVFPADHHFQMPEVQDGGILKGPGVADMKGGILAMLTALQAYEAFAGSGQLGWRVILNADEETGSHGSADHLVKAAGSAHAGMIYEPGLTDGTLSRARKGSANFTLVAKGESAHAGREFHKGRNAIVALASAIDRLAAFTDSEKGLMVNVGRIQGGTALNVVPDNAVCQFNVRCWRREDQEGFLRQLQELVQDLNAHSDCRFSLHGGFSRPPKTISPANQLFMDWAVDCGRQLSEELRFADTGGCCDGNNLAAAGLPNIDTLGVQGGYIHTDQEFMLIDSLTQRAKLSLLLLDRLSRQGDELLALREQQSRAEEGLATC